MRMRWAFTVAAAMVASFSGAGNARELKPLRVGDPVKGMAFFSRGWPHVSGIIVQATVTVEANEYEYDYSVTNAKSNRLSIVGFTVDLREDPSNHPFSVLLETSPTPVHILRGHAYSIFSRPMVPTRSLTSPPGWENPGLGPITAIHGNWAGNPSDNCNGCIAPGMTLGGFAFAAAQPPGVRQFTCEAWDPAIDAIIVGPEDLKKELVEHGYVPDLDEELAEDAKATEYLGVTIAPVSPPKPFTAATWAVRMADYAAAASKQGWITRDAHLARVQALIGALDEPNIRALRHASAAVDAYVEGEVAAGRMTSEADALIRLNADYLLRRAEQDPSILKRR